jgi:hypothetical protein
MELIQEVHIKKEGLTYSIKVFATDSGCLGQIYGPDGEPLENLSVAVEHPNCIEFPPSNMEICENIIQILAILLFTVRSDIELNLS